MDRLDAPRTRDSGPGTASYYFDFDRREWASLRANTPLTLSEADLAELQGINERVSLAEVEAVYLPLSRLLNLQVAATQTLHEATDTFLGGPLAPTPFVIGIAGSVAVGKSTFARILRALLSRWPAHPRVDLVTTDGFLYPNRVLVERGLLQRKGFPESYDVRRLVEFMAEVKAGDRAVQAPVYSHQAYDIVPGEYQLVDRPDIVLVEGLNVLQTGDGPRPPGREGRRREAARPRVFVSDFFDFSIYLDAGEADIERWYVERFFMLRETVFRDPRSYFHRYAELSDDEALTVAHDIWRTINGVNLRENIGPTRERARLVLEKGRDHAVTRVRLRRI
ncbi:MAG: type I pantothenate kinase [Acidobacteria bacterium]|nr:type I pantothenate kinase [Acidobacteriota bacterium]